MDNLEQRIIDAMCARLFGGGTVSNNTIMVDQNGSPHPFVGKFCLVRSERAGVHAGTVKSVQGDSVTLEDHSLRLWYWKSNMTTGALHGVAKTGLHKDSKVEKAAGLVQINGVIELIEVAQDAIGKIAENWK
jgi:hypothetical protein